MPLPFAPSRSLYEPSTRAQDIILRQGDDAARAAQRSGQIWGGAVQNLGGIAAGYVQDRAEQKQADRQAQDMGRRDAAFMDLLSRSEGMPDPKQIYGIFGPEKAPKIIDGLASYQQITQKQGEEAAAHIPGLVRGMDAMSEEARANLYPILVSAVVKSGAVPDGFLAPDYTPDGWKQIKATVLPPERTESGFTLGAGQTRFDSEGNQIAVVDPAAPKIDPKESWIAGEIAKGVSAPEATRRWTEQSQFNEPKEAPIKLTPEAIQMAAVVYRETGSLPPLGMGDKGSRQAILNMAPTLSQEQIADIKAKGVDITGAKAQYRADSGSLATLQKSRDAIAAFENTAQKNIDIFLETAGKVVDTGSPLANRAVRTITGSLLGSSDQAAFDAARLVAVNEIAKITSNPNLTGVLSDSARKEVEAFNPRSATLAQTVAVMRVLKRDMANRIGSLDSQLNEIKSRMSGKSEAAPEATPSKPAGKIVQLPDGTWERR